MRVDVYDYRCGFLNRWFGRNIQFSNSATAHRANRFSIVFIVTGQMEAKVAAAFYVVNKIAAF
jgi:hypothetical protein